jgi:hypothetical protein
LSPGGKPIDLIILSGHFRFCLDFALRDAQMALPQAGFTLPNDRWHCRDYVSVHPRSNRNTLIYKDFSGDLL